MRYIPWLFGAMVWVALHGVSHAHDPAPVTNGCPAPSGLIVYPAEQEIELNNEMLRDAVFTDGQQHFVELHAFARNLFRELKPLGCGVKGRYLLPEWDSMQSFGDAFVKLHGPSMSWSAFQTQATESSSAQTGFILPGYQTATTAAPTEQPTKLQPPPAKRPCTLCKGNFNPM